MGTFAKWRPPLRENAVEQLLCLHFVPELEHPKSFGCRPKAARRRRTGKRGSTAERGRGRGIWRRTGERDDEMLRGEASSGKESRERTR